MKAYLIAYDLKRVGGNYSRLFEAIKSSPHWCHYLGSAWIVISAETSKQISNRLNQLIDKNDRLLVIAIEADYSGWLPSRAWQWLHKNLPKT